jgi:hypothetical protein
MICRLDNRRLVQFDRTIQCVGSAVRTPGGAVVAPLHEYDRGGDER